MDRAASAEIPQAIERLRCGYRARFALAFAFRFVAFAFLFAGFAFFFAGFRFAVRSLMPRFTALIAARSSRRRSRSPSAISFLFFSDNSST